MINLKLSYKNFLVLSILIFAFIYNFSNSYAKSSELYLESTVKIACESDDVKKLQNSLINLGLSISYNGSTGYYGKNTHTAVKAIQRYYGVTIDGITSGDTIYAINTLLKKNTSIQRATLRKYQDRYLFMMKNGDINGNVIEGSGRKIYYRGNENTNCSSRNGNIPRIIVNHITDTNNFYSTHLWFTKSYNTRNSANFVIDRDGIIYQYVKITNAAWANGVKSGYLGYAKSEYVRNLGYGVNSYSVSIEHVGTNGYLTESQFAASVWLHKYIRDFVRDVYGYTIPFNRTHVIGHYQIDPINKYFCPGPNFPWTRLMKALNE